MVKGYTLNLSSEPIITFKLRPVEVSKFTCGSVDIANAIAGGDPNLVVSGCVTFVDKTIGGGNDADYDGGPVEADDSGAITVDGGVIDGNDGPPDGVGPVPGLAAQAGIGMRRMKIISDR